MVECFHDSNFSEKFLKTAWIQLSFIDNFDGNLKHKKVFIEYTIKLFLFVCLKAFPTVVITSYWFYIAWFLGFFNIEFSCIIFEKIQPVKIFPN